MSREALMATCASHAERLIESARRLNVGTMHLSAKDACYIYVVTYARIPITRPEDTDDRVSVMTMPKDEVIDAKAA